MSKLDYMDVYTTYTMLFVAAITASGMAAALFNAYVAVKVRRDSLFWLHCIVQGALLTLSTGKILELVSPVQSIMDTWVVVQKVGSVLLSLAVIGFLSALKRRLAKTELFLRLLGAGCLAVVFAAASYLRAPKWLLDCSPICAFLLWNGCLVLQRQNVFAEMSDLSIDGFMEKVDDAILIFARSDRLVDFNRNAAQVFPFVTGSMPADGFYGCLEEISPSQVRPSPPTGSQATEPVQFEVQSPIGTRYYMHYSTPVMSREGLIATVLTFHDVTEETLLLGELEEKNAQLDEFNRQLKEYISVADRLEDEREKNRAVMEIQEVIGERIAELLIGLEAVRAVKEGSDTVAREKIAEVIDNCRAVMSDVRRVMERLAGPS